MSVSKGFPKTSAEVLDYQVDWSSWLGSDTVSGSEWAVTTGLTIDSSSFDTTATTVWLSGGTVGSAYTVTNTITTAGLRTATRSFNILLNKER